MHENNCTLKEEMNWKYTVIGFLNYMYNIIFENRLRFYFFNVYDKP